MAHTAKLPVHRSGKRDGGQTGHHVNFNHSPVHNHENHDVQGNHSEFYKDRLHPQPEQGADVHALQGGFQVVQHTRRDGRTASNQPGRFIDHTLRYVEHRHDDVERVGQNQHGNEGFEHPLEEHPCVDVVKVIAVDQHLNQLIAHNEGEHQPGYRQNNRFGKLLYHGEHPGVP